MSEQAPKERVDLRILGPTPNWTMMGTLISLGLFEGGELPAGSTAGAVRTSDPASAPALVDQQVYDMSFAKGTSTLGMAIAGLGPFLSPLDLRALAVVPMDDRLVLMVKRDLGVSTLAELLETRGEITIAAPDPAGTHPVVAFIEQLLRVHGASWNELRSRGWDVDSSRPGSWPADELPDVVLDGAIMSPRWKPIFHSGAYRPISVSAEGREALEVVGHRFATLPTTYVTDMSNDEASIEHIDIAGWPLFCHRSTPDWLAHATVDALARKVQEIFDMTDEAIEEPFDLSLGGLTGGVPLHPGAKAWYEQNEYETDDE